jgi:hypothetical protein
MAGGADPRYDLLVISDLDIWRAANLLIRKHGDRADLEARQLADLMLDRATAMGRSCGCESSRPLPSYRRV